MSKEISKNNLSVFEQIKQIDDNGLEFTNRLLKSKTGNAYEQLRKN